MLLKSHKKQKRPQKPRYLRYDDVFLSRDKYVQNGRSSSQFQQEEEDGLFSSEYSFDEFPQEVEEDFHREDFDGEDLPEEDLPKENLYREDFRRGDFRRKDFDKQNNYRNSYSVDPRNSFPQSKNKNFFSEDGGIINERMVNYKKRQLPPLQRYKPANQRNFFEGADPRVQLRYWEEQDSREDRYRDNSSFFKSMWQRFIVVFSSILSLICISWIAYHWGDSSDHSVVKMSQEGYPVIEPTQPSFKILPENPGGVNIPHQDRIVYEKMNNVSYQESTRNSKLLPPPPGSSSATASSLLSNNQSSIEEISIVDEKIYYVKISENVSKMPLITKLNSIKNGDFHRPNGLEYKIKSVKNAEGKREKAILIGPFESKENAMTFAQNINCDCSIVSVKEDN
jgi:hypothetical protein